MSKEDIIKIIMTSTIKQYDFEITQLGETLWKLTGSIPDRAIYYLQENGYTCYLSNDEFLISALGRKT